MVRVYVNIMIVKKLQQKIYFNKKKIMYSDILPVLRSEKLVDE